MVWTTRYCSVAATVGIRSAIYWSKFCSLRIYVCSLMYCHTCTTITVLLLLYLYYTPCRRYVRTDICLYPYTFHVLYDVSINSVPTNRSWYSNDMVSSPINPTINRSVCRGRVGSGTTPFWNSPHKQITQSRPSFLLSEDALY